MKIRYWDLVSEIYRYEKSGTPFLRRLCVAANLCAAAAAAGPNSPQRVLVHRRFIGVERGRGAGVQ